MGIYIGRLRVHDQDTRRRVYARQRAEELDSARSQMPDWYRLNGKSEDELATDMRKLEELIQVWRDVADQHEVDD